MKEFFSFRDRSPLLQRTLALMAKVKDIEGAASVLAWDQETFMPPGSVETRSYQSAALDVISHNYMVSDEARKIADDIKEYNGNSDDFQNAMFRLYLRQYEKAIRLPEDFVVRYSKLRTQSIESWKSALHNSNFKIFEKDLNEIVELKIEETNYLGFREHRYNALLDEYEPGLTVATLDSIFSNLKTKTLEILARLTKDEKLESVDDSFFKQNFNFEGQIKFVKLLAERMKFDMYYGRMDTSVHPFTTSFSPKDVRITTKFSTTDIRSCMLAAIHELGHGLYEQGIQYELDRTFACEGASYGLHESQSLIWENIISRTPQFWMWAFPHLRQIFPGQFNKQFSEDLYKAVNIVRPSLIRIEADELTYNLHIIIRYEIEKMLLSKQMRVYEIPEVWNRKMREYLGVVPSNDSMGCLQDIHWSHGSFGYFPTYTLGKLYSAMIWNKMKTELPTMSDDISTGNFIKMRLWLKNNMHQYGSLMTPKELIVSITGSEISEEPFLEYINNKIDSIYYN